MEFRKGGVYRRGDIIIVVTRRWRNRMKYYLADEVGCSQEFESSAIVPNNLEEITYTPEGLKYKIYGI
jgi:hypothetical protein